MGTGTDNGPGQPGRPAIRGPAAWNAGDRQPKYLRIHSSLRERITGGQWPPGSLLPSQRELAAEFGVSIMTVRQALQVLTDEGLIQTRHGSGTFAAAHYAYDLGHLRSFASDLSAQGANITTELLAAGAVTPPADVGARLGAPGEVLRLRRLRLSGGRPLIVQTSYLPAALAHVIEPEGLARLGLYTLLAENGLTIARAQERISPTTLGPRDARDLARPQSSPALLSHRISFTAAAVPLIDDHALLPADNVVITVNRSAEHLEVHYTLAGNSAQVAPMRAQKQTI
jgi:GntR family transcriptional regulator